MNAGSWVPYLLGVAVGYWGGMSLYRRFFIKRRGRSARLENSMVKVRPVVEVARPDQPVRVPKMGAQ